MKDFEKQIYDELDLNSKLLVVYGDQQDLEEAKEILIRQKQKFTMKSVHILDKEEFE